MNRVREVETERERKNGSQRNINCFILFMFDDGGIGWRNNRAQQKYDFSYRICILFIKTTKKCLLHSRCSASMISNHCYSTFIESTQIEPGNPIHLTSKFKFNILHPLTIYKSTFHKHLMKCHNKIRESTKK